MNAIKEFKDADSTKFYEEFSALAESLAKKHGVRLSKNSSRWNASFIKYTAEFQVLSGDSESGTRKEAAEWNRYAAWNGLDKNWLNMSFEDAAGMTLKIVGWKNRNRKDKVIMEDLNGRRYKASINYIKRYMEKK